MIALFRPDFVMNQFYPPFTPVDLERFAAAEPVAKPGYSIRLHLTRETDYGDRLKLYRIGTPEIPPDPEFGRYGVKLKKSEDGRYEVADLLPKGLAEQAGVGFGDYVTEVDVEQVGLPSKRLVYPFALVLLGLVIAWQLIRRRREPAPRPVDITA
jgi:hypothetical protein